MGSREAVELQLVNYYAREGYYHHLQVRRRSVPRVPRATVPLLPFCHRHFRPQSDAIISALPSFTAQPLTRNPAPRICTQTICQEVLKKRQNDVVIMFWRAFGVCMEGAWSATRPFYLLSPG